MSADASAEKKIFGLDLMRVGAILLVLAAHILWIYPNYKNLLTKAMNFSGFIGVELFFVLSGFLIGGSLYRVFVREDYNLKIMRNFMRRRMLRIMPNYILILLVNIAVFSLLGYHIVQPWKYFLFLQNFAAPMLPFFPESWSMAIKEIPYLIIPFVLLFLAGFIKTSKRDRLFLMMTLLLIALPMIAKISFYYRNPNLSLPDWNIALRSVAIYRIDAVMTGVLFAWLRFNYDAIWKRSRYLLAISGFIMLTALAILIGFVKLSILEFPFFYDVLFLPIISIACAFFIPFFSEWKSAPAFLKKPVQFLGTVSYFVYLVHYSLVLFLMKLYIDTSNFNLWQLHMFTISYLLITFTLSWLLYRYFELPVLNFRARKTKSYGTIDPRPTGRSERR
jgi:peptidoglycan/LPS O-acetylase OafA/YrhL